MLIEFIRSDLGVNVKVIPPDERMTEINGSWYWKAGAQLDVPKRAAQLLVGNCDAIPADDECDAACGDWRANREHKLAQRELLARGILKETMAGEVDDDGSEEDEDE
jgi:hypothetical protein